MTFRVIFFDVVNDGVRYPVSRASCGQPCDFAVQARFLFEFFD